MTKKQKTNGAFVGVTEHGNSAILITLNRSGDFLDRRHVDLTCDLPTHPYHHEGSWAIGRYRDSPWARDITLKDAIALIERVHAAAERGAKEKLEELAKSISVPVSGIALRVCPELPPTIEERIRDHKAQTAADSVMYRDALAKAAKARGWSVHWYDRRQVFDEASEALDRKDAKKLIAQIGRSIGPPWQAKHKLAAAAAMAAAAAAQNA